MVEDRDCSARCRHHCHPHQLLGRPPKMHGVFYSFWDTDFASRRQILLYVDFTSLHPYWTLLNIIQRFSRRNTMSDQQIHQLKIVLALLIRAAFSKMLCTVRAKHSPSIRKTLSKSCTNGWTKTTWYKIMKRKRDTKEIMLKISFLRAWLWVQWLLDSVKRFTFLFTFYSLVQISNRYLA